MHVRVERHHSGRQHRDSECCLPYPRTMAKRGRKMRKSPLRRLTRPSTYTAEGIRSHEGEADCLLRTLRLRRSLFVLGWHTGTAGALKIIEAARTNGSTRILLQRSEFRMTGADVGRGDLGTSRNSFPGISGLSRHAGGKVDRAWQYHLPVHGRSSGYRSAGKRAGLPRLLELGSG